MGKISRFSALFMTLLSFVLPGFAVAQSIDTVRITAYAGDIKSLINSVFVPVLFAVAFLTFVYGVYKYFILGADNDGQRETGRQFVLWGVIGFVVILSVWGLVTIALSTLGLTAGGTAPSYPTL